VAEVKPSVSPQGVEHLQMESLAAVGFG